MEDAEADSLIEDAAGAVVDEEALVIEVVGEAEDAGAELLEVEVELLVGAAVLVPKAERELGPLSISSCSGACC